jgi:hypothetical protein
MSNVRETVLTRSVTDTVQTSIRAGLDPETALRLAVNAAIDAVTCAGVGPDRAEVVVAQLLSSTSLGLVLNDRNRGH